MPPEAKRGLRVVIFGATGMVGAGVLIECLDDQRIASVLVVGRKPCGVTHPKVRELIRSDFFQYDDVSAELRGLDACFFCLGVSSAGMAEPEYTRLTYDLTLAAANALCALNPGMTFCYVSGEGPTAPSAGSSCGRASKGGRRTISSAPARGVHVPPGFHPAMRACARTALYRAVTSCSDRSTRCSSASSRNI
jgi:uncharacterized protein YbjT (DUF2867 family)